MDGRFLIVAAMATALTAPSEMALAMGESGPIVAELHLVHEGGSEVADYLEDGLPANFWVSRGGLDATQFTSLHFVGAATAYEVHLNCPANAAPGRQYPRVYRWQITPPSYSYFIYTQMPQPSFEFAASVSEWVYLDVSASSQGYACTVTVFSRGEQVPRSSGPLADYSFTTSFGQTPITGTQEFGPSYVGATTDYLGGLEWYFNPSYYGAEEVAWVQLGGTWYNQENNVDGVAPARFAVRHRNGTTTVYPPFPWVYASNLSLFILPGERLLSGFVPNPGSPTFEVRSTALYRF